MTETASTSGLDAIVRFLEIHGDEFLSWRDGCVVVSTYHAKRFRILGGDTNRLLSLFEEYCNMDDAGRKYIEKASNR